MLLIGSYVGLAYIGAGLADRTLYLLPPSYPLPLRPPSLPASLPVSLLACLPVCIPAWLTVCVVNICLRCVLRLYHSHSL